MSGFPFPFTNQSQSPFSFSSSSMTSSSQQPSSTTPQFSFSNSNPTPSFGFNPTSTPAFSSSNLFTSTVSSTPTSTSSFSFGTPTSSSFGFANTTTPNSVTTPAVKHSGVAFGTTSWTPSTTTPVASPSMFSVQATTSGTSTSPALPAWGFGSTTSSTTSTAPALPAFGFASTTATTTSTTPALPAFGFGSTAAATTSNASSTPALPAFGFGSTAAATTSNASSTPALPAFGFGSTAAATTSNASSTPASPGFGFGSTAATITTGLGSVAKSTSVATTTTSSFTGLVFPKASAPASTPALSLQPQTTTASPVFSVPALTSASTSTDATAKISFPGPNTAAVQTSSSFTVASSSGTASSTLTTTVSPAPKLPSEITGKTVEEDIFFPEKPGRQQKESSPLVMDDIVVAVREPQLKRKADPSDTRPGQSARVEGGRLAPGVERTGGRPGFVHRSRVAPDLGSLDLELFKASQSQPNVPGACTSGVKMRVSGKVTGKSVIGNDDLDRNLVYVDELGVKRTVQRGDCSYKSAKLASCLLESIALDGDRSDLDSKDLAENLRLMDLAQCMLISGYQKLKETAQIAESEKGLVDKLKEELKNVQDIQIAEKKEFDEMKSKYEDGCLDKIMMGNELAQVKAELTTVTNYAKHCKEVAQKANDAYNALDVDYIELEQAYFALKEEHERGASGTPVLDVPEDVGDVLPLGASSLDLVESRPDKAVAGASSDAIVGAVVEGILEPLATKNLSNVS